MIAEATKLVASRELSETQKEHVAQAIAFSAMKFDMLVIDANKKIIFDMKKALRFDGETGPYLQYTYARCAALLRK
jgi:arginyl-tRNA synthetase